MKKKITIYDLAKHLDVSPATVSRSLNNHPSISKKTKERVVLKASELGYKVNKLAVNLSTQKTNTIGVIIPKLNSNFVSTLIAGIEKVANEAGYNIIISQSLELMEKEKLNAITLFNSGVDALLVSLAFDTVNFDHFDPFVKSNIPLIFMDRVPRLYNCPTIVIDNVAAGYEATLHLIAEGCKNILLVGGNFKRNVYSDRLLGYQKALMENNIVFDEKNVISSDLKVENVKEIISYVKSFPKKIDGLFVLNDLLAAYIIKELKIADYKIPEEIKIVGFNNDPISELISPTLSTIEYKGYEMGLLACKSIISQLKGNIDFKNTTSISLRHQLIVRESSCK